MQPSWNVYEPSWKTSTERLIFSAFVFYFVFFGILGVSQSELVLHPTSDVTELVRCYDETLTTLLDKFVPLQKVRSTARPSAPWFDADCRRSKAKTRKLEKVYRKKPYNESRLAWRAQFADQRALLQTKLRHYWTTAIDAYRSSDVSALLQKRRLSDHARRSRT